MQQKRKSVVIGRPVRDFLFPTTPAELARGEVIDEPETIVARVEQAMEHVDKRRITLAPDCGFAPGNAADIPVDEAYEKLHNMVRAARLLRAKHGG